ncbi:MAG TPA: NAD-dependent epimerase/dehydratase family protein [Streptosporangiaceae bacterium]|nr:NAD-dependent epimerase/dehydratase family protein [Streptosporangiaceae bacterium]
MRAVVTGAAGFIGSHLVDYLLEQGHEVIGFDALLPGRSDRSRIEGTEFYQVDIRDSRMRSGRLVSEVDYVFHTAAVSTTPWAVADPITCNDINVTGTLNLLEGARAARVKRFVFSSSNIVYAAPTAYKVSKLAAEGYCETYSHLYGLSTIALRYSNVFGSLRQNPENAIMSMRASARDNGYIWLTGDGEQTRDFTNVADICRANLLAAESDLTGSVDICTGFNHTMNEVATFFGCPIEYRPDREGDIRHIRQHPGMARDLLNFEAQVPFEEGMRAYL